LAEQLPERYVTPFTSYAQQVLSLMTGRAVADVEETGGGDLEAKLTEWCREADNEVQRRINFGTFE
jgi:hypothetical protein